jgi:glycosyltransferase involved in cell wall biosynthesis
MISEASPDARDPIDRAHPLRVLWVGTKAPLPALDGGRLAAAATLEALAIAGAEVTLVAPASEAPMPLHSRPGIRGVRTMLVASSPQAWWRAAWRSARSGRPLSVERHANAAVAARVAELVQRERFDVIHAEQVQALAGAAPAVRAGIACVLRAQNVESAVWAAAARRAGSLRGALLRIEARRLRAFEAAAIAAANVTIAFSPTDAARLTALAPDARIVVIPPPFARDNDPSHEREDGETQAEPRVQDFVWLGSPGWAPNDDGLRWLIESVWPAIAARVAGARLHVFGAHHDGVDRSIIWHPAPGASRDAFAAAAILLLPLRIAAGVRMRLLEAWARDIPVIASPAAVDGLEVEDGGDVLVAPDAESFARAAVRLTTDAGLRARLAAGGRATLARRHDSMAIAYATIDAYRDAIARRTREGSHRSALAGVCGPPA